MSEPSPEYWRALADSKRHHVTSKTYNGRLFRPHAAFVKEIIDRLGCKSILDYGAGKGLQYDWVMPSRGVTFEQWWGITATKYDPAWPPYAVEPVGKHDLVICAHTLGTIPVKDLSWVVDRLYAFADKAIYIAEKIGASTKRGIFSNQDVMPVEMAPFDWMRALERVTDIEVTLACREFDGVMRHYRLFAPGQWDPVIWPVGVRVLDHTWA